MPSIKILPTKVWSKIAAGEVVERPAAALKELIENSIDAGSTFIAIEVEEGGLKKIKVTDNGFGIEPADMQNAFVCHATSKIATEHDLQSISTLGFRGEALSSIAAVSLVSMTSRTKNCETATKISLEDGIVVSTDVVSAPVGTTVLIENLFYNVPARIKFLKKTRYEEMDISATVSRLILANPSLSVKLTINQKVVFATNGRGLKDAIYEVYGKEIYNNLLPIRYSNGELSVEGFVGNKTVAKSNRTFQTLTINGRYVTNMMVSSAVQQAYDSFLMKGQFPFFVLNLSMPFESVDVNVHPNKMEVKFEQNNLIFSLFHRAVFDALSSADFVAKPFENVPEAQPERAKASPFVFPKESYEPANTQTIATSQPLTNQPYDNKSILANLSNKPETLELKSAESVLEQIEIISQPTRQMQKTEQTETLQAKMFADTASYKVVGTAFETYIMVQHNEKLLFIDQHAAHERELFDDIMQEITTQKIIKQDMLFPFIRQISSEESAFLEQNIEVFTKAGFDIDFFGKNTLRVSALPYVLKNINLDSFLSAVFFNIQTIANKPLDYAINKFATMACKAAIKAGQVLSGNEIEALLTKLSQNEVLLCPHGRPIVVEVGKKDIEKWFKRIV